MSNFNPHVDPFGIAWVAPGVGGAAITPNDSTDLPRPARGILVGVAGNVAIVTEDGSALTVPATAGLIIPWRVLRVKATGTTATSLFSIY
jgi:hypothetical protein